MTCQFGGAECYWLPGKQTPVQNIAVNNPTKAPHRNNTTAASPISAPQTSLCLCLHRCFNSSASISVYLHSLRLRKLLLGPSCLNGVDSNLDQHCFTSQLGQAQWPIARTSSFLSYHRRCTRARTTWTDRRRPRKSASSAHHKLPKAARANQTLHRGPLTSPTSSKMP
jgi:hypothetical protein